MQKWLPYPVAAIAATASVLAAPAARALTISDGGFAVALGCVQTSCSAPGRTFELGSLPLAPVSGSIAIDDAVDELEFDISVRLLRLDANEGDPNVSGGEDNGVAEISFLETRYRATGLHLLQVGSDHFVVMPSQNADVDGMQVQRDGDGDDIDDASGLFDRDARVTGTCTRVGGNLTCGLTFGGPGFELMVGDPNDDGQEERFFRQTANLVASGSIPEPSPGLLLAAGLVGLGVFARRPRSEP